MGWVKGSWRGSSTCAPGSGPRIAFANNLRGQGSRLSAGQAEGCPHAPEEAAPSPTVGFRVIIDGLLPIPEVTLSLVVGKDIQQAKKIPMNASGGGDYRREESPAHIQCRVAGPILVKRERRWVLLKVPRCDIDGVGEGK